MSRLVDQIKPAVAAFVGCKTTPALVGGLALVAHQVVRTARDVDFLADADDADRLLDLSYRSEGAANYLRDDEGLDATKKGWICCMQIAQWRGVCSPMPRSAPRPWDHCASSAPKI